MAVLIDKQTVLSIGAILEDNSPLKRNNDFHENNTYFRKIQAMRKIEILGLLTGYLLFTAPHFQCTNHASVTINFLCIQVTFSFYFINF